MASKSSILVLDLEPLVRSVITSILETEGYEVKTCADLQNALETAKTFQPALVLTNIYVPGTTGHEAAKALRAACPDVSVLMVTGLPDDEQVRNRTAGDEQYEFFPKPFTAKELRRKVKQMIDVAARR